MPTKKPTKPPAKKLKPAQKLAVKAHDKAEKLRQDKLVQRRERDKARREAKKAGVVQLGVKGEKINIKPNIVWDERAWKGSKPLKHNPDLCASHDQQAVQAAAQDVLSANAQKPEWMIEHEKTCKLGEEIIAQRNKPSILTRFINLFKRGK